MSRAGLFGYESSGLRALPLQRVSVAASVYDLCAEVKVTQVYFNDRTISNRTIFNNPSVFPNFSIFNNPCVIPCAASTYGGYGDGDAGVECVFVFPLDEESAVISFTCELDGRVVQARIQEKAQARATYSHAVRSNMSAMLLEQQAENVFTCRVGRLRQGSTCIITITYLTLLDQEGRLNRLTLPLSIAPKYTPPTHTPPFYADPFWKTPVAPQLYVHNGHGCDSCLATPIIGPRFHCTQCLDYDLCSACYKTKSHDHVMQEITGGLSSSKSVDVQALPLPMESIQGKLEDLTIDISVQMPSHILSMQCTSHPQDTRIQQQTGTRVTAHYCSKTQCFLSKDFVVIIEQEACFDPRVLCELDVANRTAAVSLAFIPRPLDMMAASQLQCELIFILDCSGSMEGASIRCVGECMQLLLRSLPVNSIFNIIRFGNAWSSLFPSSSPYNNASLHAASQYVLGLRADLGGTELYAPLEYALCNDLHTTHPRQIFLLTDAQVSNVDSLVGLVSKHGTNLRVFTIGIGQHADRSLCKRIAQAGNGKCEFVSADDFAGGVMRDKVMRQLGRALQPALTEVKVDWKTLAKGSNISTDLKRMSIDEVKETSNGQSVMVPALSSLFLQCPSVAPAIFVNSRFVLHALNVQLPGVIWDQADKDIHIHEEVNISARASYPNESVMFQRSVILTGQQLTRATVIHTLAARARIRELEELVLREIEANTKKKLEEEILVLSLKYSIASSKASFVVVYDNGDVNPDALQIESLAHAKSNAAWLPASMPASIFGAGSPYMLPAFSQSYFPCSSNSTLFGSTGPNTHTSFGSSANTSFPCSSGLTLFGSTGPNTHTSFGSSAHTSFGSTGPNVQTQFGSTMPTSINASMPFHQSFQSTSPNVQTQFGSTMPTSMNAFVPFHQSSLSTSFGSNVQTQQFGSTMPTSMNASVPSCQSGSDVHMQCGFSGSNALTLSGSTGSNLCGGLVFLQSANGTWDITPPFVDILRAGTPSFIITMESLKAVCVKHRVSEQVVATLAALLFLDIHCKERQSEWQLLASKSQFYLANMANMHEGLQSMILEDIKLLGI